MREGLLLSALVLSVAINYHLWKRSVDAADQHQQEIASTCPAASVAAGVNMLHYTLSPRQAIEVGTSLFMHMFGRLLVDPQANVSAVVKQRLSLDSPMSPYLSASTSRMLFFSNGGSSGEEDSLTDRMKLHGAFALESVIDPQVCERAVAVLQHIYEDPETTFIGIRQPIMRRDTLLTFEHPEILEVLYRVVPLLKESIVELLGDEDPLLCEFGSLVTYPGAIDQKTHVDAGQFVDERSWLRIYTAFVYLDDVEWNQGALELWPGTHQAFTFVPQLPFWLENASTGAPRVPPVRFAVKRGTVVVYDQRALHRGTANTHTRPRPTLYFSFGPAFLQQMKGRHFYDEYVGHVRLSDVLNRDIPQGIPVNKSAVKLLMVPRVGAPQNAQ